MAITEKSKLYIVVDRLITNKESEKNENSERRIKDSLDVAYKAGN